MAASAVQPTEALDAASESAVHRALVVLARAVLVQSGLLSQGSRTEWSSQQLAAVQDVLSTLPSAPDDATARPYVETVLEESRVRRRLAEALGHDVGHLDDLIALARVREALPVVRRAGAPERLVLDRDVEKRFRKAVAEVAPVKTTLDQLFEHPSLLDVRPSVVALDVPKAIRDLRHGGRWFGLDREVSDKAIDRCRPHFRGSHGRHTMASTLERWFLLKATEADAARLFRIHDEALLGLAPADARGEFRGKEVATAAGRITGELEKTALDEQSLRRGWSMPLRLLTTRELDSHLEAAHAARRRRRALALPAAWALAAETSLGALQILEPWQQDDWAREAVHLLTDSLAALDCTEAERLHLRQRLEAGLAQDDDPSAELSAQSRRLLRLRMQMVGMAASDLAAMRSGPLDETLDAACDEADAQLRAAAQLPVSRSADAGTLRVAVMGRTKAGKSQLLSALTGDAAFVVGRGLQRTTRSAVTVGWDALDVTDTPGVAALGGEEDEAVAWKAADDSDAVIWVYSESLLEHELEILLELLRRGTPVLVVYNAKFAVDRPHRRDIFRRSPEVAFGSVDSHHDRLRQVSAMAETRDLTFVHVHARAAWWAVHHPSDPHAEHLMLSSNMLVLTEALDTTLAGRAEALRLQKRHDDVRRTLQIVAAATSAAADRLEQMTGRVSELEVHRRRLHAAVARTRRIAEGRLQAKAAAMRGGLGSWLQSAAHAEDPASRWIHYLREHDLLSVVDDFATELQETAGGDLSLLGRLNGSGGVSRISEAVGKLKRRSRGSWWSRVLTYGAQVIRRVLPSAIKALTRGKGNPWLMAAAGLAGAARGVAEAARAEKEADRAHVTGWTTAHRDVCERSIEQELGETVHSLLAAADAAARDIDVRTDRILRILAQMPAFVERLREEAEGALADVAISDELLVRHLVWHATGVPLQVITHVDRRPNAYVTVHCADEGTADVLLENLPKMLAEEVDVKIGAST